MRASWHCGAVPTSEKVIYYISYTYNYVHRFLHTTEEIHTTHRIVNHTYATHTQARNTFFNKCVYVFGVARWICRVAHTNWAEKYWEECLCTTLNAIFFIWFVAVLVVVSVQNLRHFVGSIKMQASLEPERAWMNLKLFLLGFWPGWPINVTIKLCFVSSPKCFWHCSRYCLRFENPVLL